MGDDKKKKKSKNTCKAFKGKTYCSPAAYKRAVKKKGKQAKKDANKSARVKKKEVRKSEKELKKEIKELKKNPQPVVSSTEKYGNPRFL
tara:strand:+ start:274 stop:540 length:267 start_codon:yes stop_codon:yes gene_type:complete